MAEDLAGRGTAALCAASRSATSIYIIRKIEFLVHVLFEEFGKFSRGGPVKRQKCLATHHLGSKIGFIPLPQIFFTTRRRDGGVGVMPHPG